MSRVEIRFAGFGGQGIGLMGRLVGEAVSLLEEGKNSVMTQSYGPESRGGASSTDVVIEEGEIDYPKATELDYFVALSEEAYQKYIPKLKEGGILFVEEDLVTLDENAKKAKKIFKIPATKIAESLGSRLYANIAMLGFVCANTKGIFSEEAMITIMKEKIKARFVEKNLIAFQKGMEYKSDS
ncbi:MAG: 2-oxoacid:acceptor oxidoreductase family protein [Candidatus Heimdallarchaeota archaeon]|nr:pyruvate ferredoxin oxidoreductase [Candidatus Heimdallarchaeota archaeon]MCG3257099.1 2-oxoacid:acceptor oxidoreductase family protein [Candidatus Heimdallarchaeota archaeon]MCK4612159.1 2-oxoacid:acceptor oxidoreductase family protein [Candidatus Heimdallarchaeota archaeon]